MNGGAPPAERTDPLVRLVQAQAVAIDLIKRGLRPKQIACMTGLNNDRVNQLRAGLIPPEARLAKPPLSASTILRQPKLRAAASCFAGIYRRLAGDEASNPIDWPLFLESYDIYLVFAHSQGELLPTLPIEDAFTIVQSMEAGGVAWRHCERHAAYLIVPDHARVWGCPYCMLARTAWSDLEQTPRPHGG